MLLVGFRENSGPQSSGGFSALWVRLLPWRGGSGWQHWGPAGLPQHFED